ncbi:hypothetical protein [Streptomyces wuyuanensis]|uniref:hypothetical protein n=1 Tax=Streptomyces wuyuanensis TaxID=1196353 RepID=UPI00341AF851
MLLFHKLCMEGVGILEAASLLVPEGVATDNDIAVSDVWDHLATTSGKRHSASLGSRATAGL